jgi:hypothetical protein
VTVIPIEVAQFWTKVEMQSPASCWLWRGAQKGTGYGKFREHLAHRYAYRLHRGEIPEGLMIRHMCGRKLCVNPAHLETGTMKENAADGMRLGETLRGAKNGRAKIGEDDARYILTNPDGMTGAQLARKFGVSTATVSLIRSGRRWAHAA